MIFIKITFVLKEFVFLFLQYNNGYKVGLEIYKQPMKSVTWSVLETNCILSLKISQIVYWCCRNFAAEILIRKV